MRKIALLIFAVMMILPAATTAQPGKIVGKWYTIDEEGNKKSLVVISKGANNTYEGVIEKLLTGDPARRCVNCTGEDKDKPIAGMRFIKGLKEDGDKLSGGTILDPANGKVYNCTISLDKKSGKLKVRGSLDKSGLLGRNQTWERAQN